MRAANQSVGTFRTGDNYYVNDGGTLREVTKEAFGKANTSGLTAEELKGAYIKPIKDTLVPVEVKDGFETSTQVEGVYDTGVSDKPAPVNGIDWSQQTEFNMNNVTPGEAEGPSKFSNEKIREVMKSNYFSKPDDDDDE